MAGDGSVALPPNGLRSQSSVERDAGTSGGGARSGTGAHDGVSAGSGAGAAGESAGGGELLSR